MITDYEPFYHDPQPSSWEKVTKRTVDPITFFCQVNVTSIPRIEDCWHETGDVAVSQPRFRGRATTSAASKTENSILSPGRTGSGVSASSNRSNKLKSPQSWQQFSSATPPKLAPPPRTFLSPKTNPARVTPTNQVPSLFASAVKPSLPPKSPEKGRSPKVASLGAFFSKTSTPGTADIDTFSVGSRSIGSRSISERSNAERSKAEERLRERAKQKKKKSRVTSSSRSIDSMLSIDEQSITEFSKKDESSVLGQFLHENSGHVRVVEEEVKSTLSGSTKASLSGSTKGSTSFQLRLRANESKNDKKTSKKLLASTPKKPLKSIMKKNGTKKSSATRKVTITDTFDFQDFPLLSDKEYYRDWDDIWYSEEELGDMRYEAFLEEAGLDVNEYANM